MLQTRPLLCVSLVLLAVLLVGAGVQSALGAGESFPVLRWYLAAHAFCYALLITARDQRPRLDRFAIAASFAGAAMVAVVAIEALIGLAVVNSRAVDFLAIVPLAFVVAPILLVVASVGVGLGYGLSIAAGRVIWFPGRSKPSISGAILHAFWGMAVCFVVAISTAIAMGLSLHSDAGLGFHIARAGALWLVSLPHLAVAWRFERLQPWDGAGSSAEAPPYLHKIGLVAAIAFAAVFLWSLRAPLLSATSGSVMTVKIGDRTYFVPESIIKKAHLDNLGTLERRWIYIRMPIGGSEDTTGLDATAFNVHVVEEEARGPSTFVERMNCARNLFGTMSGCWTEDAMDWKGHYPFPRPEPEFTIELTPPHVVSRIDIVVLDGQRHYQALLSGLTGGVKIDDGLATWEFLVRDAALPDLDKIIMGARAFQERLKQRPKTANADL